MSRLTEFYLGERTDTGERYIEEIWNYKDHQLEYVHDWVQWAFPLIESSNFNPDAPLLMPEDIQAFKNDLLLQQNLLRSFRVYANFLGLELVDYKVQKAEWFKSRLVLWKHPNHNWWRITRVITSLGLLGLGNVADSFFQCLKKLHEVDGYTSEHSFKFWRQAWSNITKSQPPC